MEQKKAGLLLVVLGTIGVAIALLLVVLLILFASRKNSEMAIIPTSEMILVPAPHFNPFTNRNPVCYTYCHSTTRASTCCRRNSDWEFCSNYRNWWSRVAATLRSRFELRLKVPGNGF